MKKSWIFVLIFVILLIFISFYFDSEIVKAVSSLRTGFLDDFFLGLTFISSEIIIFFFLTSLFLWRERKRKWILPLWFSLAFSVIISFILKILVQRERPFQLGIVSVISVLEKANFSTWNFSFPSFQTMFVFCAIPILSKEFPRFKYIWIILASLVAFSRVYFGLHFLSDALAGGLIGYLIGCFMIIIEKQNNFGEKVYKRIFGKK